MTENRIRLADRPELSLSRWIAVHVRVIPFTELEGHLVSGDPRQMAKVKLPCRNLSSPIHQ